MNNPEPMINHMREAEARGWQIEAATDDACVGRCPTAGCSMRVKLRLGASIPVRVASGREDGVTVYSFNDAANLLIDRRHELRLTSKEVDHAAGFTEYLIAKAEMATAKQGRSFETVVTWANALGFDVVFKPSKLPAITLRALAESRDMVERRGKVNQVSRRRSPQDRQV